jgi:hypothetical protein
MTQSYKLGPGSLTLGSGPLDVTAQITSCKVAASENVRTGDDLDLLDGNTLAGEESASYRFTISGNIVQDLGVAGVIAWSWTNKGTEQPFVFVPSTDEGRQVSGVLRPIPLDIGGDAKSRPRADFTWSIIGDPDLGPIV